MSLGGMSVAAAILLLILASTTTPRTTRTTTTCTHTIASVAVCTVYIFAGY